MTIADWLVDSMSKLKDAGIPNGRTDCLVMLTDLFDKDKSWIHTHPEHKLDELQLHELNRMLDKRASRVPLAYIRGFTEFYDRKFTVNSRVLIPRPESESFIDLITQLEIEVPKIADIGTGSGCLGITAALQLPDAIVDLYDIDPHVLELAHHNAREYDLHLNFIESNLLENLNFGKYDVIMANLPYVPNKLITSPEIEQEPALALFSGNDGLTHYKTFWHQMADLPSQPTYVLTESLHNQHLSVEKMACKAGYELMQTDTLVQLFTKV